MGDANMNEYKRAIRQNDIINEVKGERQKQDEKWGVQNHEPSFWMCILGEEYGEVCKEVCEMEFTKKAYKDSGGYSSLETYKRCRANYRTELIQTAAVALAALEDLDSRKIVTDNHNYGLGKTRTFRSEANLDHEQISRNKNQKEQ
jgi:hypothetical protein